ncbi:AraC family transcriptional regulator [Methylocella tundrae]|uniref:AraC family transcriptional regulator n=1 Tax=Methylocella tundrae TaxID=227605 RepID=A0A8B6M9P0_METTU|nr:helix-turn-helix domain-containing protein [Methylocella tundrae]VTZ26824.1 AraC family transcriptional regulator [Methylocella tundrae]VTZ50862.1 AraC family transcriptional regulator [Methylocella tundrae]
MKLMSILAMPGVQLLDVSGPLDVFAEANAQSGREAYRLRVVASIDGPIRSSSGIQVLADLVVGQPAAPSDTLLIAGAPGLAEARFELSTLEWVRSEALAARRYGSVCTGAFLLAAAGLLDGRRATTHWAAAKKLASGYPAVLVEEDAIYLADGPLRTAAGVTAGMDLALALVEEDFGRDLAMKIASQLVMYFKRPGGQMQFSRRGEAAPSGRSALQEVQRWIAANPSGDHAVENLAARAGVSARHFARLFRSEVGMTPAAYVEIARVDAARRLLESGAEAPKQVAAHCGFASADTLRRAFVRHVGVTPADYRKSFGRPDMRLRALA